MSGDDVSIGPIQHSRSLCAVPSGCRCWCSPCEAHNRRAPVPLSHAPAAEAEREHRFGRDCWCGPERDDSAGEGITVWRHNK